MEVFIEDFNKVMNGFKIEQIVVTNINANTKVKSSVSSINYLEVPKFDKVSVLCITY